MLDPQTTFLSITKGSTIGTEADSIHETRPTHPGAVAFSALGLVGGSYECSCNHDQG